MSIWSLTYQQSVSKLYQSDRHLSHIVLPTKWRQKSAGMDVEQNYVTVTLYIVRMRYYITVTAIWMVSSSQWTRCKMFRCSHVRTANTATWKRTKPRMEHDILEEHLRHPEDRGNGMYIAFGYLAQPATVRSRHGGLCVLLLFLVYLFL